MRALLEVRVYVHSEQLFHLVAICRLPYVRYSVYVRSDTYAVVAMHLAFMVQSSKAIPRYIDERIEAFIEGFRKVSGKCDMCLWVSACREACGPPLSMQYSAG